MLRKALCSHTPRVGKKQAVRAVTGRTHSLAGQRSESACRWDRRAENECPACPLGVPSIKSHAERQLPGQPLVSWQTRPHPAMQLYDGLFSASGSRGDLGISSENEELKMKNILVMSKIKKCFQGFHQCHSHISRAGLRLQLPPGLELQLTKRSIHILNA